MLMPSALPCDYGMAPMKPQRAMRPKLPSFDQYDPMHRSQSPVLGLVASCRTLQNMLGERFQSTSQPPVDTIARSRPICSPFGEPTPPPVSAPPPRSINKRDRNEFEDGAGAHSRAKHNIEEIHNKAYLTPKRRRIVPLDLPPGLQASDFEALAHTVSSSQRTPKEEGCRKDIEISMPEPISQAEKAPHSWTETDDRLLVETVLSKLNLSSREWNDCAVRLGKDQDSLGRRWQLLLGEGNVGLRRGSSRMERVDLDIKSW